MKLLKLSLNNFRPFYGDQVLEFSSDPKKNVTVVHAENGLGKTTLLNALLWVLYGKDGLTEDLQMPDRLINEEVESESDDPQKAYTEVKLDFECDSRPYTLCRSLSLAQQHDDASNTTAYLSYRDDRGETIKIDDKRELGRTIQTLLPQAISPYLFFNGERIDNLGRTSSRDEVREAIYNMLGLSLLQKTIEDLESSNVAGEFKKKLREDANQEMQNLLDQHDSFTIDLSKEKDLIENHKSEIKALEKEIASIKKRLSTIGEVKALQKERERLEEEIQILGQKIADQDKRLKHLVSTEGAMIFTEDLVLHGKKIMSQLRSEGRVPARVVKDFIEDLLKAEECICGRALLKESDEYKAVMRHLEEATDSSFNEAVAAIDNAIGAMDGKAHDAHDNISEASKIFEQLRYDKTLKQDRVKEIDAEIGNKDFEEIQDLNNRLRSQVVKKEEHLEDKAKAEERVSALNCKIQSINSDIERCKQKKEQAEINRNRLSTVEKVAETLQNMLNAEMHELREILNEEIGGIVP